MISPNNPGDAIDDDTRRFILESTGRLMAENGFSLRDALEESILFAVENEYIDGYTAPFNRLFDLRTQKIQDKSLMKVLLINLARSIRFGESMGILLGGALETLSTQEDKDKFSHNLEDQAKSLELIEFND